MSSPKLGTEIELHLGCFHPNHHVCHGSCALFPVMDHLERRLFHHALFLPGSFYWTPWREIYTRLPKRIYSKLLATPDLEIKYKPKVCVPWAPHPRSAAYHLSLGPCVTDLECHDHLDVSRTPPFHRPRPTAPLPSS